jgi:hypothetical protein
MAEMEIKVVKSFYIWSSSEMKINQLFNWFQLYSSENCFAKVAGHGQNRLKWQFWKRV